MTSCDWPPDRTVRARLTMKPTSEGGIKQALECPVWSFHHRTSTAVLGLVIAPEDNRRFLSPGDVDVIAELLFYVIVQDIGHVVSGTEFDLWYVERAVGHGQIL